MTTLNLLHSFQDLLAANPHTGSAEQVVTLSIAIADASETLDRSAFGILRDESGINSKVFSKLKVIGETLKAVEDKKRRDVIKRLPASYSTIHALCTLNPEELVTAVSSGAVDRKTSVRAADKYVKQVRFPYLAATGDDVGTQVSNEKAIFGIHCPESVVLTQDSLQGLEGALKSVCQVYGVVLRKAGSTKTTSLKKEDRALKQLVWRRMLEKELTLQWFQQVPDQIKKQFNLRTHEELLSTPLRSFTGFLVKAEGSRDAFWEHHGKAYVAKLHYEQEKTDDKAQRFNLKKRLDDVLTDSRRSQLLLWRNQIAKQSGVFY